MRHPAILVLLLLAACGRAEDEKVFSGPQVGEKLVSFKTVGVYDDLAGKEIDPIKQANGKPIALVFVHKLTRPSAAVMRAIAAYGGSLQEKGVSTYLVWLTADKTDTLAYLKRARRSLNFKVPVVISTDGAEGPGAYGLNRKMTLTVLVGNKNKVTANYALVQPSLQGDAVDIAVAIAKTVDAKAPNQQKLTAMAFPNRKPGNKNAMPAEMGGLLRQVINKNATPEEVDKAAKAVEEYVGNKKKLQRHLGRVSKVGIQRKYGTEAAQKHLKIWAEKYGQR